MKWHKINYYLIRRSLSFNSLPGLAISQLAEILMLFAEVLMQTVCFHEFWSHRREKIKMLISNNFNVHYHHSTQVKRFSILNKSVSLETTLWIIVICHSIFENNAIKSPENIKWAIHSKLIYYNFQLSILYCIENMSHFIKAHPEFPFDLILSA